MRPVPFVAVAVLLFTAGCGAVPVSPDDATPEARNATVVEVVDGDTVDVRFPDGSHETVRLLGIDTPEVYADNEPDEFEGVPDTEAGETCLRDAGERASLAVTDRIAGQDIRLEFDPQADRRGGYDRLLAYVIHDGTNLNYWLLERGDARVYDTEFAKAEDFYAAESAAQAANRGLWNCTTLETAAG
ncbi:MAG: thermonuclease family protein [Halodesulfurarchaeum sp.]